MKKCLKHERNLVSTMLLLLPIYLFQCDNNIYYILCDIIFYQEMKESVKVKVHM
jgi:hypothetical protein